MVNLSLWHIHLALSIKNIFRLFRCFLISETTFNNMKRAYSYFQSQQLRDLGSDYRRLICHLEKLKAMKLDLEMELYSNLQNQESVLLISWFWSQPTFILFLLLKCAMLVGKGSVPQKWTDSGLALVFLVCSSRKQ